MDCIHNTVSEDFVDVEFTPTPTTITPVYLWASYNPVFWTTYTRMNDWKRLRDLTLREHEGQKIPEPVTISDIKWRELHQKLQQNPHLHRRKLISHTHSDDFKQAYLNQTKQIAYRYPNPGSPRVRQGRIGGSWRHIKEVLGHGGNRVLYVDGRVSVYDSEHFTDKLQNAASARQHVPGMLGTTDPSIDGQSLTVTEQQSAGDMPWFHDSLPSMKSPYRTDEIRRKLSLEKDFKTKGFYKFK